MYKVIIADDEKVIRMGLRNILDWEKLGFEVSGIFSDGEEVLDYLDYTIPDVILTDVKMANLSGLDVAKYVMEHQCPCKVVIVSGYHEFDSALKALKYGADEYLLKPVDPEELTQVFTKIRETLDKENAQKAKSIKEQELMRELQTILESQFLEEIVLGAAKGEDYLSTHFGMIYPELDLERSSCFLVDINIQDFNGFIENDWGFGQDHFEEKLDHYLRSFEGSYLYRIVYKRTGIVRLLAIRRVETALEPENAAKTLVHKLEDEFRFRLDYNLQGIYQNIRALAFRNVGDQHKNQDMFTQTQFNEQIMLMRSNTVTGNHIRAQEIFRRILDTLRDEPVLQLKQIVWNILDSLRSALQESNLQLHSNLQNYMHQQDITAIDSYDQLAEYCDRIFDFIRITQSEDGNNVSEFVLKAKHYICENIFRDVSREEVAAKVFVCPSYLSKLFVKETGETYLTFVNSVKIEKAKELLKDPEIRSYQIGEMLGYSTPKYFSRLFKTQTGMTPSEYRRKVLLCDEDHEEP